MDSQQTRAGGTPAKRLPCGARVGGFVVRHCAEGGLTLRGSRRFATGRIVLGAVLTLFGLCFWASLMRGDMAKTGASGKVLIAPFIGIISIASGLLRFADVWKFDGNSRTFACFGFFGHQILPPGGITCLRVTILPTNLNQRETIVLELNSESRIFSAGRRRSKKADAINLLAAADHISTLLQVPIELSGDLQEGPAPAKDAMSMLYSRDPELNKAA